MADYPECLVFQILKLWCTAISGQGRILFLLLLENTANPKGDGKNEDKSLKPNRTFVEVGIACYEVC